MKRFILLAVLLIGCLTASAQELSVGSFQALTNDMTANIISPKTDQNGNTAAVIKVITTQTGFTFDGGMMGIVDSEQHPSEIWVWVPVGLKHISIMHPQLGQLRSYYFPETIKSATTYELVLTSGTVTTIVDNSPTVQYFVVRYTPADVNVDLCIDDTNYHQGTNGYISVPLNYGQHTYRLEAPNYNSAAGVMQIDAEKKEISVDLKTMCGSAYISSSPENGAEVYYNGRLLGTTPMYTEELVKGDYEITLKSPYYLSQTATISILEGQQTIEKIALTPNYSDVTILVGARNGNNTDIVVNNEYKGKDSVTVRLTPGTYIFEARKTSHRTYRTSQDIRSRGNETIILNVPTPIYGALEVKSSSPDASIYIDNVAYGTTPNVINEVLTGSHTLQLKKSGYETYSQRIDITEGETKYITAQLKVKKQTTTTTQTEPSSSSNSSNLSGSNDSSDSPSSNNTRNSSSINLGINMLTLDFGSNELLGATLPGVVLGFGSVENSVNFSVGAQFRWTAAYQTESSSYFGDPYLYTNQISIPLNFKVLFGKAKRNKNNTRFFIGMGANCNFNLASKIKYKYTNSEDHTESEELINIMRDYPELINKTTFSGIFSAGLLTGDESTFCEISLFTRYDFTTPYVSDFAKMTDLSSYIQSQAECKLFIGFNFTLYVQL